MSEGVSVFLIISVITVYMVSYLYIIYKNDPFSLFIKKYILSENPILVVSNDSNFHTIEKHVDTNKYRYSLLCIPVGEYKLYFCTYRAGVYKWYFVLSLDYIFAQRKEEELNKSITRLNEYLPKYIESTEKEKERHEDILKSSIEIDYKSIETAKAKGAIYFAVALGFIALYSDNIDTLKNLIWDSHYFFSFLTIFSLVLFFNFLLFIIQYHSVKGFTVKNYSDYVKESNENTYYEHLFSNMTHSSIRSFQDVSYIKNTEFYIKKYLLFAISLILIQLICYHDNNFTQEKGEDKNESTISCELRNSTIK